MRVGLFLLISVCLSCNYFQKKTLDSHVILDKELQTFQWDQVDQYPTFETCQEDLNFQQNKSCFESTLTTHVSKVLNSEAVTPMLTQNDSLKLKFLVSSTGDLSIPTIESQNFTDDAMSSLVAILTKSLQDLPLLFPAIKRSQQVQSEFQLPIILKVK
jgi:hypothetical protein